MDVRAWREPAKKITGPLGSSQGLYVALAKGSCALFCTVAVFNRSEAQPLRRTPTRASSQERLPNPLEGQCRIRLVKAVTIWLSC